METVTDFIFLGSKITADGDYSHEINKCLLLVRKAMTNLDGVLKNRDITLPTKVHPVKAMIFPLVIYGCWTIKKVERWRIDAFELCCWRRLLGVPWSARRSNQSILKEISPEYSLEGLMLKLQNFGYWMWRTDSLEKTPTLGKIEGGMMVGWHHQLGAQEFEQVPGVGDGQGSLAYCSKRGHKKSQTRLSEWTEQNWTFTVDKVTCFFLKIINLFYTFEFS